MYHGSMANYFGDVQDAFYSERKEAANSGRFYEAFAWDTAIDNWDRTGKGVYLADHIAAFNQAMDTQMELQPDYVSVWKLAKEYVEAI